MKSSLQQTLDAMSLTEGQRARTNCPVCGGFNTFSATKQNGAILYNCYRLDCKTRGASTVGMTATEIEAFMRASKELRDTTKKRKEPMEIPPFVTFETREAKSLIDKWGLYDVELMYDIVEGRLVFPIRDETGCLIDMVGRLLKPQTYKYGTNTFIVPKWKRYSGGGSYYSYGRGSIAVVVEDAISAVAAAKMCTNAVGVAILGTSLNKDHIEYLKTFDLVLVALDPDAAQKTVAYKRQLDSFGINAKAVRLTDDIKYRKEADEDNLKRMCGEKE